MTEIRALSAGEIPRVHDLWRESGLAFRPDGRDGVAAMAREMAAGRTALLGAFEGGDLQGVVLVTHDGRKGWINRLAVRAACRRRHVARSLLREAESTLAALGVEISAALVEEGNGASLALFEAGGYTLRRDVLYLRRDLTGRGA